MEGAGRKEWYRAWLERFVMLVGIGFLLGIVRQKPDDLLLPFVIATALVYPGYSGEMRGLVKLIAGGLSAASLFLFAAALHAPLRRAVERGTGDIEREWFWWMLAALGMAALSAALWLEALKTPADAALRGRGKKKRSKRKPAVPCEGISIRGMSM